MLLTSVFISNIISQSVIQKTVNATEYPGGGGMGKGGFMKNLTPGPYFRFTKPEFCCGAQERTSMNIKV